MWDSMNHDDNDTYKGEIPDDFDLYSLVMPDKLKREEKEEIKEDDIETVKDGMKSLKISTIFDKYLPNNDWYPYFCDEMSKDYFKTIEEQYKKSLENSFVYPKRCNIFRAFNLTSKKNLSVVILGQDPYPGVCPKTRKPYANGLAFSVNKECSIPGSLRNMYKELDRCGLKVPKTGELESWSKQGVFLMNTQLSVEKGKRDSHKFWQKFTDNVIKHIATLDKKIIFVLMGRSALKKYKFIPKNKKTKIIITSHPSSLSFKRKLRSYPAFYESNIFIKINNKLEELGLRQINW